MSKNRPRPLRQLYQVLTLLLAATSLLVCLPAAAVSVLRPPVYVEDGVCIEIGSKTNGAVRLSPVNETGYIQVDWNINSEIATLTMDRLRTGQLAQSTYFGQDDDGNHIWSIWIATSNNRGLEFKIDVYENGAIVSTFDNIQSDSNVECRALLPSPN